MSPCARPPQCWLAACNSPYKASPLYARRTRVAALPLEGANGPAACRELETTSLHINTDTLVGRNRTLRGGEGFALTAASCWFLS